MRCVWTKFPLRRCAEDARYPDGMCAAHHSQRIWFQPHRDLLRATPEGPNAVVIDLGAERRKRGLRAPVDGYRAHDSICPACGFAQRFHVMGACPFDPEAA